MGSFHTGYYKHILLIGSASKQYLEMSDIHNLDNKSHLNRCKIYESTLINAYRVLREYFSLNRSVLQTHHLTENKLNSRDTVKPHPEHY